MCHMLYLLQTWLELICETEKARPLRCGPISSLLLPGSHVYKHSSAIRVDKSYEEEYRIVRGSVQFRIVHWGAEAQKAKSHPNVYDSLRVFGRDSK